MGFAEAVKTVLGKYADFSGRARRSEYWYWTLAIVIGALVLLALASASKFFFYVLILYYLAILIPTIAVAVRRLHDTGRSGWWLLLDFVPFGGIVLLVWFVSDSKLETNAYGASPKATTV